MKRRRRRGGIRTVLRVVESAVERNAGIDSTIGRGRVLCRKVEMDVRWG